MISRIIEVLDPTAQADEQKLKLATRLNDLNGKTLGMLDNSKPNFDLFLDRVEELLRQHYKIAKIVRAKKDGAGIPFKDIARFVSGCDAVITGMCD